MIERIQLSHVGLWTAVVKAPLILVAFVAPFLAGILISPTFATIVHVPEFMGVVWFSLLIGGLVYLNGLFGSFIFGTVLFYFLNAIRMQNKWIYYLSGFAGGTFFNFMRPWYSQFLNDAGKLARSSDVPIARVAMSSYPILFGMMGLLVAWYFWRDLSKAERINAD